MHLLRSWEKQDHHDDRLFPVLWLVTNVSYDMSVSGSYGDYYCPFSSLCACINTEEVGGRSSGCANSLRHVAFSPFSSHLLRAQEGGGYTCTGVRAIINTVHHRRRRSKDCTAYTFLHRLCTTTSNIHTIYLVWMEPLIFRTCVCFTVV
jgi:hypothetical protein